MLRSLAIALLLVLLSVSCSHLASATGGSLDDAQRVADDYLHQLRWGNLRAASADVRGARRKEFRRHAEDDKLDDHLKVTEYEVKDAEREGKSNDKADVSGDITWYVEPSVTAIKEKFHLHLVYLSGQWFISWMEKGPVALDEKAPETDGGAPAEDDVAASDGGA